MSSKSFRYGSEELEDCLLAPGLERCGRGDMALSLDDLFFQAIDRDVARSSILVLDVDVVCNRV